MIRPAFDQVWRKSERLPAGDGAHTVINRGDHRARVLMFSSAHEPAVAVYPDSDKIGVWTPGGADNVMLRREDGARPYFDREAAAGSTPEGPG